MTRVILTVQGHGYGSTTAEALADADRYAWARVRADYGQALFEDYSVVEMGWDRTISDRYPCAFSATVHIELSVGEDD